VSVVWGMWAPFGGGTTNAIPCSKLEALLRN
jgi:hypothetical protein